MTFSGFYVAEKNWKLSFLWFRIVGDVPSSLFLITETHALQSSTSLFHFYASAKKVFLEKMQERVADRCVDLFFEKVTL